MTTAGRVPPASPHWSERWIGRDWRPGVYECSDFVAEVLAAEFGLAVDLPRASAAGGAAGAGSIRARDRLTARLAPSLARPLGPGEAPREGDGVLMRARGRRGARGAVAGHHIGLWCAPGGEPSALHCAAGLGSCVHALAGLPARGLEADGIWRWTPQGGET